MLKKLIFKIIGIILVLSLLGFFIYIAYSVTWCQDYEGYLIIYNGLDHKDKGFVFINKFLKNMGFDFVATRTIIYIFAYLIMFTALSLFKANKNFTFALYALYPWCYHAFQTRTCLGFAIIMLASTCLLLKGKLKTLGIACFSLLTYFAYSMHGSMIIYGIIIAGFFCIKNKNYFVSFGFVCTIVFLIFYYNGVNLITDILPEEILDRFFNGLYSTHIPNMREYNALLLGMSLQVISIMFAYIGFRGIKFGDDNLYLVSVENTKEKEYIYIQNILFIVICAFCMMPIITISTDMVRLIRNVVLIVFAGISISARNAKYRFLNPWVILSLIFILSASYVILDFSDSWETGGVREAFWRFFSYPY